jgi:prepilin-type N-terminal cleavage/methylation domain
MILSLPFLPQVKSDMLKSQIPKTKEKKAFLLIEVLLTIAILAAGLTVLVRSLFISLQAGKLSADYLQAEMLLENKLSLLESQGIIADGLNIGEDFDKPDDKFKFNLKTENIKVNGEAGFLNKVSASVIWKAQKASKNVALTTCLINEKVEEE